MEKLSIDSIQIGDWVYRIDFNTPVPSKIIGIEVVNYDKMEYVVDVLNKNGYNVQLYLNEIKPIPITPEILEKNGWEQSNIDVVDDDVQYGCAYGSFYVTWWRKVKLLSCYFEDNSAGLHYEMISEMPIKYVHQLQNALRLCGIDKEIEL